jgi:hypothetical protein
MKPRRRTDALRVETCPDNVWPAALMTEAIDMEAMRRHLFNMDTRPKLATSERAIKRDMAKYLLDIAVPAGVA